LNVQELSDVPPWEWPEEAAALILGTLTDRKASETDRLTASEMAGDMIVLNEKLADALLNVIKSGEESVELRSRAAISLGPGLEEAWLEEYNDSEDLPALSESFVHKIQRTFHDLYSDAGAPIDVRRAVLESSIRHPQDWHADAVRTAYDSNDIRWRVTAVFCMRFAKGFEAEILAALKSPDPKIHRNAVEAAGNWELDAAWPHISNLVTSKKTEKSLLLAAIGAASSIRPAETEIIEPLADSCDEDISEAAMEALAEAGLAMEWESGNEEDEEDDEDDGNETE
jgi:hypothetical protein